MIDVEYDENDQIYIATSGWWKAHGKTKEDAVENLKEILDLCDDILQKTGEQL